MTNPTDLHDHHLERDLRDMLHERAERITGPAPDLTDTRVDQISMYRPSAATHRRRWVAAGAVAAVLAVGAAGVAVTVDRDPAQPVVVANSVDSALDPRPSTPIVLGGFDSSDEAVQSFLERTVGPEHTDAARIEERFATEIAPGIVNRQVSVTLRGGDLFSVMTLLRNGAWTVTGSYRALSASDPLLLQDGNGVELLFAHPHDAESAVVWYLGADGQTLEAEIDRAAMDAGRRDVIEDTATLIEADGFTLAQSRRFAEKLAERPEFSTIGRARVTVPGSVDVEGPVVVATFDSDGHPLAVWTDGAL